MFNLWSTRRRHFSLMKSLTQQNSSSNWLLLRMIISLCLAISLSSCLIWSRISTSFSVWASNFLSRCALTSSHQLATSSAIYLIVNVRLMYPIYQNILRIKYEGRKLFRLTQSIKKIQKFQEVTSFFQKHKLLLLAHISQLHAVWFKPQFCEGVF